MADISTSLVPENWHDDVPRSIAKHVIFGTVLIILSFGGFGYWATNAPLAAAVIAQGSFIATGRNKIVQHLEGGIIKSISVAEGDRVQRGQVLMQIDKTAALAVERELFLRQVRLETAEVRTLAESERLESLIFPEHLIALRNDSEIATMMDGQLVAFNVSMQSLNNDITLLDRNIEALAIRATGYVSQLEAADIQIQILSEDLADKEKLLTRRLISRSEVYTTRRATAEANGQRGRLQAEILEIKVVSQRYQTKIEQTLSKQRNAALDELQVIQAELEGVREQFRTAENVLSRVEIKAPVSGTIVRLYYHTAGGVIESGKAIAEILPTNQPLIIEVQIPRTEIDSVQIGFEATVRLTALNQRITPILLGRVHYVSADTISEKTGSELTEIYVARISIPASEILRVPDFTPIPGMPAEIMIKTAERTFIQYLTKPITDSMSRAFREQ